MPRDLKKKIIVEAIEANKLYGNGDGTYRGSLANNISSETAQRILARWR